MPTPRLPRPDPPQPTPTLLELVEAQGLTFTDIINRTELNQRTVKHRLEFPWLFNVVELEKLARLLEGYSSADLFALATELARSHGEFNPDRAPRPRRAGRPRLPRGEFPASAEPAAPPQPPERKRRAQPTAPS